VQSQFEEVKVLLENGGASPASEMDWERASREGLHLRYQLSGFCYPVVGLVGQVWLSRLPLPVESW
jgi:hypothetical protein